MTDPLIARLDALAEKANRESWELSVPCQEDADFIAALVTAWPVLRARLEAGEQLAKAARNVYDHDDAFTETSPDHHSRDKALCAAIAAYDAANAKGTG